MEWLIQLKSFYKFQKESLRNDNFRLIISDSVTKRLYSREPTRICIEKEKSHRRSSRINRSARPKETKERMI